MFARTMPFELGDRVKNEANEIGIVCSIDPPVIRLEHFHSYVLFDEAQCTLLDRAASPGESIAPHLRERIRAYLKKRQTVNNTDDMPTGG